MALIKKFRIRSFKKQNPVVSLKNISLSYGKRQILDDISFDINKGEILGMLGSNGVGKSSIFNLITGLVQPSYGSVYFDNTKVNEYKVYTTQNNEKKFCHNISINEFFTEYFMSKCERCVVGCKK